ncbi:MAG: methyl-accepting chemotaxis protein [Eubacteriales bacterium]|nr:methyl-accepting chemotaxis protein [Eubacteriales bacterium]
MKKIGFRSIRARFLGILIPLTVISLTVLFLISFQSTKSLIDQEISEKMSERLNQTVLAVEKQLGEHSSVAKGLAKFAAAAGADLPEADFAQVLENYISLNEDTFGAGIWFEKRVYNNQEYFGPYVYRDGEGFVFTDEYNTAEYDFPSQEWYVNGVNAGGDAAWTDAYYDATLDTTMLSTTVAFYNDDKLAGTTTADIDLGNLQTMIADLQIGKTGQAFLLDESGVYIASRDSKKAMTLNIADEANSELAALGTRLISEKTLNGDYKSENGRQILYSTQIPETGWILALSISEEELYQPLYDLIAKTAVVMIIMLIALSAAIIASANNLTGSIRRVIKMGERLMLGDLQQNISSDKADETGELTRMFANLNAGMLEKANAAQSIAQGDLTISVREYSEDDTLSKSMNLVVTTLKRLVAETAKLTAAAADGNLSVRGDESNFVGGYADMVAGINNTLEAIVEPVSKASEILVMMSKNDLETGIEGEYKGDLRALTDSVNSQRDQLLSIQDAMVRIANGDTSRLSEFKNKGKLSEQDQMIPAIISANEAIDNLIKDINTLTRAAAAGNLDIRGQADRYYGGYRQIIEGINLTINAMAEPMRELSSVLAEVAQGRLTVSMIGAYQGQFEEMKTALNYTIDTLSDTLAQINEASDQVASGAGQVAMASQNISHGSTEQASSVEELSASMTDLSNQTKDNAQAANEADKLAVKVRESADIGKQRMNDMLGAMNEIDASSQNIAKIIKVIDEIAFQTNILALNAAVEAARAGVHGKGFAVVAEEVRNLAARSAEAARETTALIEGSMDHISRGSDYTSQTATVLEEIVNGIKNVSESVANIARSSNDQASAILQIDSGIDQVARIVQSHSATAEQSAATSEELTGQASMLKELVSSFELK